MRSSAVRLKIKSSVEQSIVGTSKGVGLKKGTVVDISTARKAKALKQNKKTRRETLLSPAKKEELVLTFRGKAQKLARSILRRWHARLDLQEVDSIVDLSLCEAVRRFNPNKGASFMTFLFYHMRGNLIRAVTAAATSNLVPLTEAESQYLHGGSDMSNDNGTGAGSANALEIAAALSSQDFALPDDVLLKKEIAAISDSACNKLDSLEKEVIYRIYLHEQQLMDIARELGYSRCHISRVKKSALETLKLDFVQTAAEDISSLVSLESKQSTSKRKLRRVQRRRSSTRQVVLPNHTEEINDDMLPELVSVAG